MKALVSLSGGMDSTTVLMEAIAERGRENVSAVSFYYGSKHNKYENEAARLIAEQYEIPFQLINFASVMEGFQSNLLKSGDAIPEGHYEAESMSQTVVPGRNLIFISILTGFAWSNGLNEIWLGVHAGDHFIYPDCRPVFFHSMNAAVVAGSDEKVELIAPYLHGNKTTIIKRGLELQTPYSMTRTCYKPQFTACGKCGACQERLEAFKNNGIPDPISYISRELIT